LADRIIRTPAETEALCIGLLSAARMLREHGAELREKAEQATPEHFDYLASLLEQNAAEFKAKAGGGFGPMMNRPASDRIRDLK
jgi:hypothetical protein